jgi:hypothetical protein
MLVLAFITASYWLEGITLDPDFADMLPVMKVMNERLCGKLETRFMIRYPKSGMVLSHLSAGHVAALRSGRSLAPGYALDYRFNVVAQLFSHTDFHPDKE